MKRTIGMALIIIGLLFAVLALTHHEEEKTLLDIGNIEIKAPNKQPSDNTTMYYVIAGVCIIAGGVVVAGKRT